MREKTHRLSPNVYRGKKVVAFTACIQDREPILNDRDVFDAFVPMLANAAEIHECIVPIYVFMPDHLHVMLLGLQDHSTLHGAMQKFKTASGWWLYRNRPGVRWQRNFWDHVVKESEGWRPQARYIAANPYRTGLCKDEFTWPFMGSIGVDLSEVIAEACW